MGSLLLLAGLASAENLNPKNLKTKNVVLITTDGLRWQDVFTGADPELMNKENGGVVRTNVLRKKFWRKTPEERREVLMPFLWNTIARQGQIYGNQNKGTHAQVTNGRNFSYPGYNEILTGFPNPDINSNNKIPNPNVTVLEWLHRKPAIAKVAAFSSWDVMPFIINRDRCNFPVMGGFENVPGQELTAKQTLLNELIAETTPTVDSELYDSLLFHAAYEHFTNTAPRLLFLSLLETDAWGHSGRYDNVLESAHRVDAYIQKLWETAQSMPKYRDKTTFIITTDHGRGFAPTDWKNHGKDVKGSENIWMAFIGPDTPALGERTNYGLVTQDQIASTLAAFFGKDYQKEVPQAGERIKDVLK